MQQSLTVTWLGHSCFQMQYGAFTLLTDPYAGGSVPGLPPLRVRADAVFCSHGHADHNAVSAVELSGRARPADFSTESFSCPHDGQNGAQRGANTARLFRFGALRVAHLGDIGAYPSDETLRALRGCDALLLPVGGYYTVDAAEAYSIACAIAPRVVIPMHYRGADFGFDVLDTVEPFCALFPAAQRLPGPSVTLTESTPAGLVVPQLAQGKEKLS